MKFKLGDRVRIIESTEDRIVFLNQKGIIVEEFEGYYIICFDKEYLERYNIDRGRLMWDDDELELLEDDKEESNTYYGDEILKMIREDKLKEGDRLSGYYTDSERVDCDLIVHKNPNDTLNIQDVNEQEDIDSWDLINMTFSIKEKERVTFTEAIKSGKKFKHKDWRNIDYMTTKEVFNFIIHSGLKESFVEQLDKKVWELE